MEKRHAKRIKSDLQCELVSRSLRYTGSIENIGEDGLSMTIPPTKTRVNIPVGMTFIVKFKGRSGDTHELQCRIVRPHKILPGKPVSDVGMEIIKRPPEYLEFLKTLKK
ncbi:MAG TPA: hypothetical protein DDX85_02710 [Nitrospiraceae bacterium]|nr:hypothetical protein [Nitrospiraceae bacterium]